VCVCLCLCQADGTTPAAGTTLYIVGEGSVRVIVANAKDGEIVQEHGPGAFFGEIAFLATCAQVFASAGNLPQDLDAQLKVVILPACCCVSHAAVSHALILLCATSRMILFPSCTLPLACARPCQRRPLRTSYACQCPMSHVSGCGKSVTNLRRARAGRLLGVGVARE
jgi:hypothetical protein